MGIITRYDKTVRLDKAQTCPICERITKPGRKIRMLWSTIHSESFLQAFVCMKCWQSPVRRPKILEEFEHANKQAFMDNHEKYGYTKKDLGIPDPETITQNQVPTYPDLPPIPDIHSHEGHGMIEVPHDQYIAMYRLLRKHPEGVLEVKHQDDNELWHRMTNTKNDINPHKAPWLLHRVEMSPPVHYAHRLVIEWFNTPETTKAIEQGILDYKKEVEAQKELEHNEIKHQNTLRAMEEVTQGTEFEVEEPATNEPTEDLVQDSERPSNITDINSAKEEKEAE